MDFWEVCAIFGGTPFYDDFRGNLLTIEKDLCETGLVEDPTGDEKAAHLLCRGILDILKGNISSAVQSLDTLIDDDSKGPRWRRRGYAYKALCAITRECPPLMGPCELAGPSILMWEKRLEVEALRWPSSKKSYDELPHDEAPLDLIEAKMIFLLCRVRGPGARAARRLNVQSKYYSDNSDERASFKALISTTLDDLDNFRQELSQYYLLPVSLYIQKLRYELLSLSGSPEAAACLEQMRTSADEADDKMGLGVYWMLRGDLVASPTHSSPLLLNLDIVDDPEEFGGDSTMTPMSKGASPDCACRDHTESRTPLSKHTITHADGSHDRDQEPLAYYKEAKKCFIDAECVRGQAVTTLREGCVMHIADHTPAERVKDALDGRALNKFKQCMSLCDLSGDGQLHQVSTVLSLLYRHPSSDTVQILQDLGRNLEAAGTDILRYCMVMILYRHANFYRYLSGSFNHAVCSSDHARQLATVSFTFKSVWIQIMLFITDLRSGDLKVAKIQLWLDSVQTVAVTFVEEDIQPLLDSSVAHERLQAAVFTTLMLQNITDQIVALMPHSPQLSKDSVTSSIRQLERIASDSCTRNWLSRLHLRTRYSEALQIRFKSKTADNDFGIFHPLTTFQEDREVIEAGDLQTRSLRIHALAELGKLEEARSLLSLVADDAQLSRHYPRTTRDLSREAEQFELRRRVKSLEAVFLLCVRCRDWLRARRLLDVLEEHSPGYFTSVSSYTKLWPWQRCVYAGLVHEHNKSFSLSMQYYLQSWFFVEKLRLNNDPDSLRVLWNSPLISRLTNALARRRLRWSKDQAEIWVIPPTIDRRFDHKVFGVFAQDIEYGSEAHNLDLGVYFLEAGRSGYIQSLTLVRDDPEIMQLLYKQNAFLELSSKPENRRSADERAEFKGLQAIIEDVDRTIDDRMSSISYPNVPHAHELRASIPENAMVVYTALSEDGIMLVCVDRSGAKNVTVDEKRLNTQRKIDELVHLTLMSITEMDDTKAMFDHIKSLSHILIPPAVENQLESHSHVIFMPSGLLCRLPFGVLCYKGRHLQLEKEVSQVPSLATLHYLRLKDPPDTSKAIRVIARPGSPFTEHLPMAGIEALYIGGMLNTKPVIADNVTRTDFQQYMREARFLHISTHGVEDETYPFNSYIKLKEPFRVLDMLPVHTTLGLVTFSACLSNVGPASEAGDVQGFAHSVLAAGANAFIGALWKVNDDATMLQMMIFYRALFMDPEYQEQMTANSRSISRAWQISVQLLYSCSPDDIVTLLLQTLNMWTQLEEAGVEPENFVKNGKKKLEKLIHEYVTEENRAELDFKHPRTWAAFVLVGNSFEVLMEPKPE